jgi:hypothetical protein
MDGATFSRMVYVVVQLVAFPAASVAVSVMMFVPVESAMAGTGCCVTVMNVEQLSDTIADPVKSGNNAKHDEPLLMVCDGGQVMVGAMFSFGLANVIQVPEFPL